MRRSPPVPRVVAAPAENEFPPPACGRKASPKRGNPRILGTACESTYRRHVNLKDRTSYKTQAAILKALANESRLLIVHRLQKKACTAGELVRLVGLEQSTVSKHLAVLKANGIVGDERRGTTVVYRLIVPCVVKFLSCASDVIRQRNAARN